MSRLKELTALLAIAAASILVHGYHLGQQDAAIYIPAIKKALDPSLYPFDAQFFLAQTRWMLFPEAVAWSVRLSHLSFDLVIFLWHLASIFLVLLAAWRLTGVCFQERRMRWAAVVTLAMARLLPVAGTKLMLTQRYLHPRDLATAALLLALAAALERRFAALAWLAAAAAFHPTMALFGALHVAFQALGRPAKPRFICGCILPAFAVVPAAGDAWHEVLASRPYLFPLRWEWYELASVIVPFALLQFFARVAHREGLYTLERLCRRTALAGAIGFALAVLISIVPVLERAVPTEPARVLHLLYLLCVLVGGGLLGARPRAAIVVVVLLGCAFFAGDRRWYPTSPHIEWPGRAINTPWIEAFDWTSRHTPKQALFALDPKYMLLPGEDAHGFRAFAERSMLADWMKDRSVAALEPQISRQWKEQVAAREGWNEFIGENFQRLKKRYGVDWVVLSRGDRAFGARAAENGLDCPFANREVAVCKLR